MLLRLEPPELVREGKIGEDERELLDVPIFEKLFLGGEYSVRGFDLRTIGPSDLQTGLVLGGNKDLLFNVEQSFSIAGPVRLILFYDAGQVRDAVPTLSDKELADLAVRSSRAQQDFSAGLLGVGLFTLIILLIIVIIVVAAVH